MYTFPGFIYIIIVYCQTWFGMGQLYCQYNQITITGNFWIKVTDGYAIQSCDFNGWPNQKVTIIGINGTGKSWKTTFSVLYWYAPCMTLSWQWICYYKDRDFTSEVNYCSCEVMGTVYTCDCSVSWKAIMMQTSTLFVCICSQYMTALSWLISVKLLRMMFLAMYVLQPAALCNTAMSKDQ